MFIEPNQMSCTNSFIPIATGKCVSVFTEIVFLQGRPSTGVTETDSQSEVEDVDDGVVGPCSHRLIVWFDIAMEHTLTMDLPKTRQLDRFLASSASVGGYKTKHHVPFERRSS